MEADKTLIRGDEFLNSYFCNYCDRICVTPRVHAGGYNQTFCQKYFCEPCINSLQNLNTNRNYGIDRNGKKYPRCPAGCNKAFEPPYFRPFCEIEEIHYTRIIVECRGCHLSFDPYGYANHVLTCVPFRRTSSWTPNKEIIVPPPKTEELLNRQKLIMAKYQSKYRVLSKRDHSDNVDLPMNGAESFIKVFLASGHNWVYKFIPVVADKEEFLSKVKEAFGVTSNDADLLVLTHRTLSSCLNTSSFITGIPVSSPIMLFEKKDFLNNEDDYGVWLLLHPTSKANFQPSLSTIPEELI